MLRMMQTSPVSRHFTWLIPLKQKVAWEPLDLPSVKLLALSSLLVS